MFNLQDVQFPDKDHITLSRSELQQLLDNYKVAVANTKMDSTKVYFYGKLDLMQDFIHLFK